MAPSQEQIEAAKEILSRRRVRSNLLTWCEMALPTIEPDYPVPARHHKLLIEELQRVAETPNGRLMVFMPPGAAKSTYASKLFAPWFMARPDTKVIGASHSSDLAETFSASVQSLVREHALTLGFNLLNEAKGRWYATNRSAYLARGVGAGVAGFRADIAIIDDPVKGAEAADSETQRDAVWEWYNRDLRARLKPGGRVVLVMTRWHTDDIAGRLLNREAADWRIVRLPALAEGGDPLGRESGEPLWGDDSYGYGAMLRSIRARSSSRDWSALYQQRPYSDEGAILKRGWWLPWVTGAPLGVVDGVTKERPLTDLEITEVKKACKGAVVGAIPKAPDFIIVSLDTAYTAKEENDPTGCAVFFVTADPVTFRSSILLRYGWAKRLGFPELVTEIEDTCKEFGRPGVPMRVLVEAKASGLSVIQELRRRHPSMSIHAVNPRGPGGGDKVARAHAVSSLLEGGTVYALATWDDGQIVFRNAAQKVIDECAAFPLGVHDDQVDAVTQALRYMRDQGLELFAEDEPTPPPVGANEAALY